MVLTHGTDLLIKTEYCHIHVDCSGEYHVVREDCLGLRLPKQVQYCHRSRKDVGEMHCG